VGAPNGQVINEVVVKDCVTRRTIKQFAKRY